MPVDDIDGEREILIEARNVLTEGVARIVDDVRNSLDFYAMQEGGAAIERAVVTGPAVAVPGFSDQLGLGLTIPLEVGLVPEGRPGSFGGIDAGRLAVAAGLTVDEVAA
jgi:hypothetical protein